MSDKIKDALEARKARKKKEQDSLEEKHKKSQEKINAALQARENRISTNLQSTLSELKNSINTEIEAFKKISVPSWGGGTEALKKSLESTRKNSINVGNLIRKVEAHRKYIGDEEADSILATLKDMEKTYSSYVSAAEVRSQFETEDEYNQWYESYKKSVEKAERYKNLASSEQAAKGWKKYTDDMAKAKEEAEPKGFWETIGYYLSQSSGDTSLPLVGETSAAVKAYRNDDSYKKPNDSWTEEQKNIFGALYVTNPTEAEEYAIVTNRNINTAKEEEAINKIKESSTSGFWAGAGNTIGAIATSPLGLADYLEDLVKTSEGRPLTPDGAVSPFEYSQAVKEGITINLNENGGTLNEDIPILGGKGWGDVYGLGTSIAESFLTGAIAGGSTPGSSISSFMINFGKGAAAGVDDALARGLTDDKAVLYGTALGLAEGIFETIGIDNLFKLGSSATIKEFFINMLKQSGIEATEEGLTSIASNIADVVIAKDKSNFSTLVAQYMAQGMSKSEAQKKAWKNTIEEVVFDAISGAASGGISGSIHTSVSNIAANNEASQLYGNGAELVAEGKEIGGEAGTLAERYQAKLDKGKSLSGGQINRLVEANESALISQDKAKMQTAAETRLTELGESGDVSSIAKAIVKQAMGENLTRSEKTLLQNSIYGQRVSNEISPSNVGSGEYSNAWAENIGTERVNAEAYNLAIEAVQNDDATQKALLDVAKTMQVNTDEGIITTETNSSPAKENIVESEYEVSADGKTINKKNDKIVNIKNIESISEDGEANLTLDDGMVVKASDLAYGNNAEAIFVENIGKIKLGKSPINTTSANELYMHAMRALENNPDMTAEQAQDLIKGLEESYVYGAYNFGESNLTKNESVAFANKLPDSLRKRAYELGSRDNVSKTESSQKAIDKIKTKANPNSKKKHLGKIVFESKINEKTLSPVKQANLNGIKLLAELTNYEFHVFESDDKLQYKMPNGAVRSANGWYVKGTNEIWIDIKSGAFGEGTMLWTAGHEIGHDLRVKTPKQWQAIANLIMETFAKNDVDVKGMLNKQIAKIERRYKANNEVLPSQAELIDMAYEEMVSDALTDMLTDGSIVNFMAEVKAKDRNLWQKIGDAIKSLLEKWGLIIDSYKGRKLETAEAQALSQFEDVFKQIQEMYRDAIMEANEVNAFANDIVTIDADSNSVAPMMSERTWTESEYVTERDKTAKAISSTLGVDIEVAYKYIDDINSVARLIADDRVRLDYDPNIDENATVLKKNSDYKYSVDMSTLCAKRLLTTGTFDAIQRKLPNTVFTSEDIVALREMMLKRGYEVACGICYVESTRREMGRITQDFIDSYIKSQKTGKPITRINSSNQAVELKKTNDEKLTTADKTTDKFYADKNYTPTLADLNTTDIDIVKKEHPLVYEAYLNFMNARGQAKPKLLETRAEYKGEILKHFKSKSAVNARNNAGGLRLQSFSDFEVPHLIDMMQIVMDMSRVGLMSQAYTKVPAFAEVFGNTGVKINLSLIAKGSGLDANGNLIFDDIEGINHKEAFKLRDKFSKNVGTILVGKTDAHIIAAMADPRIDYIIPFHKSSWKESLYEALGLTGYADYTDFQNEKPIDKDRKIKNFDPSEYWDFTKSGDENAQIYLKKCREDGRIPKFPQFQGYPGYWKLLIDFKMYDNDGVGSPQEVVRPTFETEASERILNEYKGGHRNFPVAKDVVEDFVNDYVSTVKFSDRNFSYDELVAKDDLQGFVIDKTQHPKITNGIIDNDFVVKTVRNKCKSFTHKGGVVYYVNVPDIGTNVEIINDGITHGFARPNDRRNGKSTPKAITNARVMLEIPQILNNSIEVNRSKRGDNIDIPYTHVLIGTVALENNNGVLEYYAVRSMVQERKNQNPVLVEASVLGKLTSVNAKKIDSPTVQDDENIVALADGKAYAYKIADLLNDVKNIFDNTFSEDVYHHFGMARNEDDFSKNLLFSDRDSTYMDAVNNGDMETAQKMVDEAAKEAGYTVNGYHGTGADFNIFSEDKIGGRNVWGKGFYFGTNKGIADDYASWRASKGGNYRIVNAALKMDNPFTPHKSQLGTAEEILDTWFSDMWQNTRKLGVGYIQGKLENSPLDLLQFIAEHNKIEIRDVLKQYGYDSIKDGGEIVVFSPEQIKSADPVTYDDNGNVIPLSERFNTKNEDIRYSERDFPNNAEEIAKNRFGTTNKWSETGWLLKDGTQLDFSGRHWKNYPEFEIDLDESFYQGKRNMEHYEIAEAFPEYRDATNMAHRGEILGKFLTRGNIRVVGKGSVDILTMPTDEQFEKLRKYFKENTGEVIVVGIDNDGLQFEAGTNASIIVESIRDYFLKSKHRRSDLMRFHGDIFSERDSSTSNRSILANALEGAAQNDIEKNKLTEYKKKISLIEAEEQRLSEIQKQLFTKGGVEPKQRKALQFEAKQIANRINTYDRQLLRLEATKPLQGVLNREKEMARKRQKQKDAEAMSKYKEKVAQTTRELITRNQESRKKAIESREKTAMRHKIQKVVGDLNTLLLKPTKERHVPEELKIAVAEALSIVNLDTVDADTRVAKYNDLIAKAKDPDVIASLTATRDRILNQGNKLADKLTKLKDAYGKIQNSTDDSLRSMYDDVIYNKIESVQEKVGKTPLRNMTLAQLESVYELYKMVLTTVRDSNKAFAEDLKMTRQALGSNTFAEIKENNKARDTIKHPFLEKSLWQYLKPMQAMKTIGSGTLQKLWNNILYGQEVFAQDYDEAVKFAKEMKDKYGYKKWNLKKLYSFESKSGKTMKISLEQMMSIYAYSKRAQADEHIEYGGIVLNEGIIEEKNKLGKTVKVKVNDSTAYRLDRMQVGQIIDTLEKEAPGAKAFVDEMQKYLSETMGAKGNEVSMKMYGINLFKEEHYFPLKSSKDFMEAANAKLKGDVKIKNKGMTKATVEHARNPIVLENFLDVWGNHINEMAMYHGLVLPLEDFSRTLNYSFKADESLNTDAESVRTALHDAFGDNADNYINELLKAINGGVLHDSSAAFADKMISQFKKAKVMASLSVVVQQPTAIIRAMGIIEPKYFVAQNFNHKATWEELKKYCPTAIIKETGSFDTNMGRTIVDMIKDERGFTDKVGDALGKAPAWMDEMGWNMIWRALKNKVAAEQKLSGEELLKECGKQMTLILNETQVYDSVMSRNELMRSKSTFTKMATAFMAEPTTVANMIYGAALDIKRGKKGIAGKTIAATIGSVVINGLVSAFVYALRDDDEDETFLEKYLSSATTEVLDGLNPLTYIPFIKDAYSLFQGYKVERTDMALIGDVYDALNTFYNALDPEAYEGMSRKEIAKHIYENSVPLLTSICDMFGLPVGNILRDAKAIITNDNIPMSQTSSAGTKHALKEGAMSALPKIVQTIIGTDSKQDKLYDAIVNGDTAYLNRLKSGYKDNKAYETAVRTALRKNDTRIKEAAQARIDGNIAEYTRIVKEIKAEGFFSQDTIVASVNAEINAINKGESSPSSSDANDKASSIYKIDDYYASIVGGDQASAYVVKEDLINTDIANGKDRDEAESSFNGKFASYLREEYEKGNISTREAQRMLVNYGDKAEEEAASKVQYWEFKQEYPDYDDLSEEAVTKYYEKVEPYGISVGVYYDYSKQRSKCKGTDNNGDGKTDSGSVKTEVLRVINSLPISRSQKDALYYAEGWAASRLYEAPWH